MEYTRRCKGRCSDYYYGSCGAVQMRSPAFYFHSLGILDPLKGGPGFSYPFNTGSHTFASSPFPLALDVVYARPM